MNVNSITLVGRIGNEPQIKTFENGNGVIEFSLATSEEYKDAEGNRKVDTDWHQIKKYVSNPNTALGTILKKGMMLGVVGKQKQDSYQNGNGEKKYISYVKASELNLPPKE